MESRLPVICYGNASYIKSSFTLGCADFLKDPWSIDELYFRITRCVSSRKISVNGILLEFSGLHINCRERGRISLTYQESVILRTLARQQGKVISREVLAHFLGRKKTGSSRVIDVHISSLRKKIQRFLPSPYNINPIQSVRGIGYILK
jgi:DNA-binding response OmpR family regulator